MIQISVEDLLKIVDYCCSMAKDNDNDALTEPDADADDMGLPGMLMGSMTPMGPQ